MKYLLIILVVILMVSMFSTTIFFINIWQEMKDCGYIKIEDYMDRTVIFKRDLPSWSAGISHTSITKIEIPSIVVGYIFGGKEQLQKDKEFREKYVYGKTIEEANKSYRLK